MSAPFLLQQTEFFQFRQKIHGLLLCKPKILLNLTNLIDDIHAAFLIQPFVLHGQTHPVQKYPIQHLCRHGERLEHLVNQHDLRDSDKAELVRLGTVIIVEFHMACTPLISLLCLPPFSEQIFNDISHL